MTRLEKIANGPTAKRLDVNAWAMAGVLAAMWILLALLPATRGTSSLQTAAMNVAEVNSRLRPGSRSGP